MRKGYLIGCIILFIVSLGCIGTTVVEVIRKTYTMSSWNFWGAVIFHVVVAMIAVFLLARTRNVQHDTHKEGEL